MIPTSRNDERTDREDQKDLSPDDSERPDQPGSSRAPGNVSERLRRQLAAARRALASDPAESTDRDQDDRFRELDRALDRAEAALDPTKQTSDADDGDGAADTVTAGLATLHELERERKARQRSADDTTVSHDRSDRSTDDPEPFDEAGRAVQQVQNHVEQLGELLRQRRADPSEPAGPEPRSIRQVRRAEREAKRADPGADRRDRTKQRLARLAIVLVAATVVSPLLQSVLPGRAFAIASDSMAPVIPKGSLAITAPGDVDVGDVVVYESVFGDRQIHRVVDVRHEDGRTYYTTKGDNNVRQDSFSVPADRVLGVVRLDLPYLGQLWMIPLEVQAAIFLTLLGAYLMITFHDDRRIVLGAWRRVAPFALVLALLVPAGQSLIDPVGPASTATTDVRPGTPLPLEPGSMGQATIGGDEDTATVDVGPPKLWKEIVLWGCRPTGPSDDRCTITAQDTWTDVLESTVAIEASRYPNATFYLEAYMKDDSGSVATEVALEDSAGNTLATVESARSEWVLNRSTGFELSGTDVYHFSHRESGGGGQIRMVKLIVAQELPADMEVGARTSTYVPISGADQYTGLDTSQQVSGRSAIWEPPTRIDGTVTARFAAVANLSGVINEGDVDLVSETGATVATLSFTESNPTWRSTAVSLSPGTEYHVEFHKTSSVSGDLNLQKAYVILDQDDFTRTPRYAHLAWRADSTSVVRPGHPARVHVDSEWGGRSARLEATLDDEGAGNGRALVERNATGERVPLAAVETDGSAMERQDSVAWSLPAANVTYNVRLGTDTVSRASWIEATQRIGKRMDNVLTQRHAAGPCTWDTHLEVTSTSDLGRLANASIETVPSSSPANASTLLPGPRSRTRSVWDAGKGTAYVFGGRDGATGEETDEIVAYDPEAGTTTVVAHLPTPREDVAAVWDADNGTAYLFGGFDGAAGDETDRIVAFSPANDTAWNVSRLPAPRDGASAVWTGSRAYVFGGLNGSTGQVTDEIVAYDPANETAWVVGSLPSPTGFHAAVWDGQHAYVFGGYNGSSFGHTDEIVRFDPATGEATVIETRLPSPRDEAGAVWDGRYAYLVGGLDSVETHRAVDRTDDVVRFEPSTGRIATLNRSLPTERVYPSVVWTGEQVLAFGGRNGGYLDEIVRFTPPRPQLTVEQGVLTASPTDVPLRPGDGVDHVVWTDPRDSGTSTIETEAVSTCRDSGVTVRQPVTFRFN